MDLKRKILFGLVPALVLLVPVLAQGSGATGTMSEWAGKILPILKFVFGGENETFDTMLFRYILPAVLMYAIFFDFVYLMGMFRRRTAQLIAGVFALFAGRYGAYAKIATFLANFTGNDFVASISLIFTMALIWWTLGHIMLGYKLTEELSKTESAMDYLDRIGDHLERRIKG